MGGGRVHPRLGGILGNRTINGRLLCRGRLLARMSAARLVLLLLLLPFPLPLPLLLLLLPIGLGSGRVIGQQLGLREILGDQLLDLLIVYCL